MPTTDLNGANFYRSPARVAVLMFFADLAYLWWWLWQFFQFTKREGFPRARSFWWLLVPFYGLYVVYQQLDDLKRVLDASSKPGTEPSSLRNHWIGALPEVVALFVAWAIAVFVNALVLGNNGIIKTSLPLAAALGTVYLVRRNRQARQATLNPALLAALMSIGAVFIIPTINPLFFFALALLLGYLDSSGAIAIVYSGPITAIILSLVLAAAAYSTQGAANEYLRAKYPDERFQGFTTGEVVATLLGALLNIAYFYFQFFPVAPRGASENRVAPTGAPYSYQVPAGFHGSRIGLPTNLNAIYATGLEPDKASDKRDVIFVFIHPLGQNLDGLAPSDIKQTMDATMSSPPEAQSFISRGWVTIAGVDALEYDVVGAHTPNGVSDGVIFFLFKGANQLAVECRWMPTDRSAVVRGCDEVKRTLTFN